MQITNQENDLIIDYQESERVNDEVIRVSRFSDGRTDKRKFTKAEADKDMADFLDNYGYRRVGLMPYQQMAGRQIRGQMFLPAGLGKS